MSRAMITVTRGARRLRVPAGCRGLYIRRGWTIVDEQSPTQPPRLSTRDPKADWVEYAVACGMDRDEAEATPKADLIGALS